MLRRVQLNNPTPFGKDGFCSASTDAFTVFLIEMKVEGPINMLINRHRCFSKNGIKESDSICCYYTIAHSILV